MTICVIIDGAGLAKSCKPGNTVRPDTLPTLFNAMAEHGYAALEASGPDVGLEAGQAGNSEVGHIAIGAGSIVLSRLSGIEASDKQGKFAAHPIWERIRPNETVHVAGLLSDAGTHGHYRSLIRMAQLAARRARNVVVHPVLDGVDSQAGTAPEFLEQLRDDIAVTPNIKIGVIMGREWFCDRSGDVERSAFYAQSLSAPFDLEPYDDALLAKHLETKTEASFPPHRVENIPRDGAAVLLTSHREDRARQVAKALKTLGPVYSLVDLEGVVTKQDAFFPKAPLNDGLSHRLSALCIQTCRISETCKFDHVTFFLDGLRVCADTKSVCIPSWPEADLHAHPEMRAAEIAQEVALAAHDPLNALIVANIPNLDQIGHLADVALAEAAAGHVDLALQDILLAAKETGRAVVLTADHGNAEELIDAAGRRFGSHTCNAVPLTIIPAPGQPRPVWASQSGSLSQVAATLLVLLGQAAPSEFSPSLILAPYASALPQTTSTQRGDVQHA